MVVPSVEATVIVPDPSVIVMPVPSVSVAKVYPEPLPIRSCPLVGVAERFVPPLATGKTPETSEVSAIVPLDADVMRPCASTVISAVVYAPAKTAVFAKEKVVVARESPMPAEYVVSVSTSAEQTKALPVHCNLVVPEHVGALIESVPVVVIGPPVSPLPDATLVTVPEPPEATHDGADPEPLVRKNCPLVPGAKTIHWEPL